MEKITSSLVQEETFVMHAGCKETTPDRKDTCKNVASPKEPPSWIKHKIYNTRSKGAVDRDQVSSGGLASDKVAKVTLGRKSQIEKVKSQAKVEVKNGKQEKLVGPLEQDRCRPWFHDASPILQC